MPDLIRIDPRFCGPPTSANGGYAAGRLAAALGGIVRVRLHAPPPLQTDLSIQVEGECARLLDGTHLIAEAHKDAGTALPWPPQIPDFETAQAAMADYPGHHRHIFPGCFSCGPARAPDDGLCIFPGAIAEGVVAGTWQPQPSQVNADGEAPPEIIWAAIDCAGYWALAQGQAKPGAMLLGQIRGVVEHRVQRAQRCVIVGWRIGSQGRKHHAGTALIDARGVCIARSEQTWIALNQPD